MYCFDISEGYQHFLRLSLVLIYVYTYQLSSFFLWWYCLSLFPLISFIF